MCVSVSNSAPIGLTVAEIWPFFDFARAAVCHLGFSKVRNFHCRYSSKSQECQISCRSVKSLRRPFLILQDGARPPSWIYSTPAWATREAYLVIFISLCKNWLESAVQFLRYESFNAMRVWLENAYSSPLWGIFA